MSKRADQGFNRFHVDRDHRPPILPKMTSDELSFESIGLPGDVWIEVALDAGPLDVVSLSQVIY